MEQNTSISDYIDNLVSLDNSLGRLVCLYKLNSNNFLDEWFQAEITSLYYNFTEFSNPLIPENISKDISKNITVPFKIKKLKIKYFRGFREEQKINFSDNLTVVWGFNSKGKTSIAEAIEWLLTGQLERRTNIECDAKELTEFITNICKPAGEKVKVSADIDVNGIDYNIERILINDYGSNINSVCKSEFYINNELKTDDEEAKFLSNIIFTRPPILTQYSITQFINKKGSERTKYFESILNLSKISNLIELCQKNDAEIMDKYKNPNSNDLYLKNLSELKTLNLNTKITAEFSSYNAIIKKSDLINLVIEEIKSFNIQKGDNNNFDDYIKSIENEINKEKYKDIKFLINEKPLSNVNELKIKIETINNCIQNLTNLCSKYNSIKNNIDTIEKSSLILSAALEQLIKSNLIDINKKIQQCPLCNHESPDFPMGSLTIERIKEIRTWKPIIEQNEKLINEQYNIINSLRIEIKNYNDLVHSIILKPLSNENLKNLNKIQDKNIISAALGIDEISKSFYEQFEMNLNGINDIIKEIEKIQDEHKNKFLNIEINKIVESIKTNLIPISYDDTIFSNYILKYENLIELIKNYNSDNHKIRLLEIYKDILINTDKYVDDLKWNFIRNTISQLLMKIREELILYRQAILDSKKQLFSESISNIWQMLRVDPHTVFKEIFIPQASGRGMKPSIQIKAAIKEKDNEITTDALKVFSESHINLLGLAAFRIKCDLENQKLIVMDDPVQSMDEEHYKTFSDKFINDLLQNNYQVIILTHNQTFKKCIIKYQDFKENTNFITYKIDCSKKSGCTLSVGEDIIGNLFYKAFNDLENDSTDHISDYIRKILEILYKIIAVRYKGAKPDKLEDQTAESLWNTYVSSVIKSTICGQQLKDLLITANSSVSAHDANILTITDAKNSVDKLHNVVAQIKRELNT